MLTCIQFTNKTFSMGPLTLIIKCRNGSILATCGSEDVHDVIAIANKAGGVCQRKEIESGKQTIVV